MSDTINPCIFYAISVKGTELLESVRQSSKNINHSVIGRFVKFVYADDSGSISDISSDDILKMPLEVEGGKAANFAEVNRNRQEYLALFNRLLNEIFTAENNNFATENEYKLGKPVIVVYASIDDPIVSPLLIPLLQSSGSLIQGPTIHLCLLYNQDLEGVTTQETALYRNAFFREIDHLKSERPHVWLIDIINEMEINLKNKESLFYAVRLFSDLLITDESLIDTLAINYGDEQGKPCLYSTFGFAQITYPVEKIEEYIGVYAAHKELTTLCDELNIKFERVQVRDELIKFYSTSGIEKLPERIALKDDGDPIFKKFMFSEKKYTENEFDVALGGKYEPVESPATQPVTFTNDFLHNLEQYDEAFRTTALLEVNQLLDQGKKRELAHYLKAIDDAINAFLDTKGKGINYSLLFTSNMADNGEATNSLIEGRFTEMKTFSTIQDEIRTRLIGDQLVTQEKELRINKDECSNKQQLIENYRKQNDQAVRTLEKLESTGGTENPKYIEVKTQIETLEQQISTLQEETEGHKTMISELTEKINRIKSDFEKDTYKEELKKARNIENFKEITDFRKKLDPVDSDLSQKLAEKNSRIEQRRKFIFNRFIIIPLAILVGLLAILAVLFFKTNWFDLKLLGNGLIITGAVEAVYFIISLIKFANLNREFEELLASIETTLATKRNLFAKYVDLKNNIYFNDFNFEKDLIAYMMFQKLAYSTTMRQRELEELKGAIVLEREGLQEKTGKFQLNESSFEFSVVEKPDLESLYDKTKVERIIGTGEKNTLSYIYSDFVSTKSLRSIHDAVLVSTKEVCKGKVENENLGTVLFNESPAFTRKVNTRAKFRQIIDTSRPLLRTAEWPNLSSHDRPYTSNTVIGLRHPKYYEYLMDIKLSSIMIDEHNDKVFGILSVKTNFPSFLVYDVELNDIQIRKGITRANMSKYFIDEKSYQHLLLPPLERRDSAVQDELQMGNELIVALTKSLITYDLKKSKFVHPVIGDLGFSMDELINTWTTPICYDILTDAQIRDNEIWHFDDDELKEYCAEFKNYWINFPLVLPIRSEKELSEYFFSIKGIEAEWDEIRKAIKRRRKSQMDKNKQSS